MSFLKPSLLLVLFLVLPFVSSNAQSIDTIGNDATLDIATWNIEWFGSTNNGPSNDQLQIDNAARVIAETGIDLWGVQEIADADDFASLLSALGDDFDGTLATNSVEQKIGFIYNKNTIQVRQVGHILESFTRPFASRPPLQLEASITLPDTTVIVTFIVLHMKAFSDVESYERRVEASSRLKNHIDFTSLDSERVIVLGDMNDELEQSTSGGRVSPYDNFIMDPENYFFASLPLEQSGSGSFCSNSNCTSTGSMLDHIMMTDELFNDYITGSAGFIPDLTDEISFFGNSTSDHLPVLARFDFGQVVLDAEDTPAHPDRILVDAPYPNPFSNTTTVSVQFAEPAHVQVEVFDLLGRQVDTIADQFTNPGTYQYTFSPDSAPRGIYMIRVSADGFVKTIPVTLLN
ncbi:MAG: T9SS type A sorting domain-containing protein [Rhodothermales bacterium]